MVWTLVCNAWQEWLIADETAWKNRLYGAVVTVLVLIVTAPLREAFCGMIYALFMWIGDGLYLLRACTERFIFLVGRLDSEDYRGTDYGWAVLECVFVAPIVVLNEHRDYYGQFGKTCILWCKAWQHSVCDYMPESSQQKWNATKKFGSCSVAAAAASWKRGCDIMVAIYLVVRVTFAVIVFTPLFVYRMAEFCLHGTVGVGVVLTVIGAVDVYCEWDNKSFFPIVIVMVVGLCSHIERAYRALGKTTKVAPRPVAEDCWRDLLRRESERLAREEKLRQRVFAGTAVTTDADTVAGGINGWTATLDDDAAFEHYLSSRLGKLKLTKRPKDKARRGRRAFSRGECPGSYADGNIPEDDPVLLADMRAVEEADSSNAWNIR